MKKIILGLIFACVLFFPSKIVNAAEVGGDTFVVDGVTYAYNSGHKEYLALGYKPFIIVRRYADGSLSGIQVAVCNPNYNLGAFILNADDERYDFGYYDSDGLRVDEPILNNYLSFDDDGNGSWWNNTVYNRQIDYYLESNEYGTTYEIVSSPVDIYNVDDEGKLDFNSIFFWGPPATELPEIAERAKLAGVMSQVIRILPVAIPIVVCYLGLRKALKVLQKVLFQA